MTSLLYLIYFCRFKIQNYYYEKVHHYLNHYPNYDTFSLQEP